MSLIFCTNVLEQKIKRNNLLCFVISFVLKICFSVPKNPQFVHHTWRTTQQHFIREDLPRVQPLTFKVYVTQIFLRSYFSSTICVKLYSEFKLLNNLARPIFFVFETCKFVLKMSALLLGQIDKYDVELFVRM